MDGVMSEINININAPDERDDETGEENEQLVPGEETGFERRTRRMRETAVAEGDMTRSVKRWWDKLTSR